MRDFKRDMNRLYNTLDEALKAGLLEKQSYDVGIQLMALMVKAKSYRVAFTWHDLMRCPIFGKEGVIANTASDMHFYHYGALQQLQQLIGVLSHVSSPILDDQVAIARSWERDTPIPPNFTGEPGTPSLVIMPCTVVYCEYVPGSTDSVGNKVMDMSSVMDESNTLPAWAIAPRR